ncbi:hypothetical protein K788_0004523 [Paraburkholderia caribensis MBA4]|uniref:Uncharacterized protein n=1 Tax=Paraburkholderia caribensis MBA4 TaxID=1323664 RepID=A0A0P0RA61_9BURK|nr:hypothetical protein K788_0004523 [Paraburkholderia caribensis MBA4]
MWSLTPKRFIPCRETNTHHEAKRRNGFIAPRWMIRFTRRETAERESRV